jgi:predicted small lipoprotein YifL
VSARRLACALLLGLLLTGCGAKGDLVLPDPAPAEAPAKAAEAPR